MNPAEVSVRVSVVVPVYNTGKHIEQLIASLAAQTIGQDRFEVIFVDDGSTDDTPARLDRLALERPNVSVRHEPNSGWPGRPRNIGIDAARGDYVFFVDHDDWLGPEALQRMTDFAAENHSDIVIGRYAGHHRGVAKAMFTRNRPRATLENTALVDSLTPHKMFRRQFLVDRGLRFPEGRRRLEDQVFITEAYFLADRISVLSDYHCYFHVRRPDAGNAGFQRIDPAGYFSNVREVVDLVLAYTEPGRLRDRLLRRTFRTELLGRVDGRSFIGQLGTDYGRQVFDEARRVAVDLMPSSVDAGMPPPQRVRAQLLREDRYEDLAAYVRHDLQITTTVRLLDMHWDDEGRLVLEAEGSLVNDSDGEPWPYRRDGDALLMVNPAGLNRPVPREAIDCTDLVEAARMEFVLRRREDSQEWPVPTDSHYERHDDGDRVFLSHHATGRIDPRTLGGGGPIAGGIWDVYARISQTGWSRQARVGDVRSAQASAGRRPAILSGDVTAPYWTVPYDNLSLEVGKRVGWLTGHVVPAPGGVQVLDSTAASARVQAILPVFVLPGAEPTVRARLTGATLDLELDARTSRLPSGELCLDADVPGLEPGSWQVLFRLSTDEWRRTWPVLVALSVSADRVMSVAGPSPVEPTGGRPVEPPPARTESETPQVSDPRPTRRLGRMFARVRSNVDRLRS